MTLFIFTQQKASLPSWAPFVGEEFVHITGEFETAQAVAPGQGQAVDIAGIQVGKITSVALEDGHAVVGMDIEPKYMELIHPDATLLMRPKTNLNDMVVEVTPGDGSGASRSGRQHPAGADQVEHQPRRLPRHPRRRHPPVPPAAAGRRRRRDRQPRPPALGGAFRRFQPFVHYVADLNKAVAQRRVALARVIHDFGLLTTELGRRDTEIERFVTGSNAALGNFAHQQQALQESLVEFPATLTAAQAGLASSNTLSLAARPALIGLIPQAEALGPAFKATRALLRPDDRPDPRPDPPLHPPGAAGPDPHQAGGARPEEDGRRLRQQPRRPQRLLQRARLQAERLEAELPLLPALAQPRPQRHLQPAGRRRPGPARPGHDHLHRQPSSATASRDEKPYINDPPQRRPICRAPTSCRRSRRPKTTPTIECGPGT